MLADLTPAPAGEHDELVGLEDALARMPELQRRAILLREWRGLSYREIATELELTAAAVETLIFRARRSLAELLAGRPAPKRARRFAFDCGSIGAALKSIFGAGAGGKLVAGAAAIIAATTLAGSAGQAPPARTPEPPAVTPSPRPDVGLPRTVEVTTVITKKPQAQRPAKPKSPTSASAEPTFPESSATLEQLLDETADSQPVVSSVTGALPVQETTGVVDGTVETVTGALPSTVSDALP